MSFRNYQQKKLQTARAQKMIMRVCLVYEFKHKKSAAESHRSLVAAFSEDVVFKSQCERWFKRFAAGDESLQDEEHRILSRTAVEADPTRSTRVLAVELSFSRKLRSLVGPFCLIRRTALTLPHPTTIYSARCNTSWL
ncbi:unnamed protein product [Heligmosomoides polygyrus]|uniref:HTH_48 domain-containing protein n=1 Tax=Heligmosomoides polygyrus TaxID=6339 RepID=A0A183G938_HELPZ|nr:unnamed protein product [Heligmosomoides polygyrus]